MKLIDLLIASEAWASAAGVEHHAPSIHQIWFPLANFLIFAYIIVRFALPPIRDFLKSRREEVVNTVRTAAESKQRAEALVQDYRGRLARLDQEVQFIQTAGRADGERGKKKLLTEAEAMAIKIGDDARFLAEQEVKLARQKLRQELARLAEAAARDLVQRHISAADQSRLAEDFIRNIGQVK